MKHILKCESCGEFTLHEECKCRGKAITTKPQRYSPGRFAEYRRKARKEDLIKRGLL